MSELKTFAPISGMHVCENETGSHVKLEDCRLMQHRAEAAERELAECRADLRLALDAPEFMYLLERSLAECRAALRHFTDAYVAEAEKCHKLEAELSEAVERELAKFKSLFPFILEALGNGSICANDVGYEFAKHIPDEVQSVVSGLKAELATVREELDKMRAVVEAAKPHADWLRGVTYEETEMLKTTLAVLAPNNCTPTSAAAEMEANRNGNSRIR